MVVVFDEDVVVILVECTVVDNDGKVSVVVVDNVVDVSKDVGGGADAAVALMHFLF